MERSFSAQTEASPETLYEILSDLATYPHWLGAVHRVEAEPPSEHAGHEPAWQVTLRARVGPLARSKRLRMVRTLADGSNLRFERCETSRNDHATWKFEASVTQVGDGPGTTDQPFRSEVQVRLLYEGRLWSNLLDGILGVTAETATRDLQRYAADSSR